MKRRSSPIPGTSRAIVAATAAAFDLTLRELLCPSRIAPRPRARQAAAWVLRHEPKLSGATRSYPEIARALRLREHSSVLYACRQAEIWRARDPVFAARIGAILAGACAGDSVVAPLHSVPRPLR